MDRETLIDVAIGIVIWNALLIIFVFIMSTKREKARMSLLDWIKAPFALAVFGAWMQVVAAFIGLIVIVAAVYAFEHIGIEGRWPLCFAVILAIVVPVGAMLYRARESDMPGWAIGVLVGLPMLTGVIVLLTIAWTKRYLAKEALFRELAIWNGIVGGVTIPLYLLLVGLATKEQPSNK
jgi:hypothetical protein